MILQKYVFRLTIAVTTLFATNSYAEMGYGGWVIGGMIQKASTPRLTKSQKTIRWQCQGASGTSFRFQYTIAGIYANKAAGRKVEGTISHHSVKTSSLKVAPDEMYSFHHQIGNVKLDLESKFGSDNRPYFVGTAVVTVDKKNYSDQVTCRRR